MVRARPTTMPQTRGRETDAVVVSPRASSGAGPVLCIRYGRALRRLSAEVTGAPPIDLCRRDNIDVLLNSGLKPGKENTSPETGARNIDRSPDNRGSGQPLPRLIRIWEADRIAIDRSE